MKRNNPYLRSKGEIKQKDTKKYGAYLHKPSKLNPLFLKKPYESL